MANSSGNASSKNEFEESTNVAGEFPSFYVVSGSSGGTIDLTSDGNLQSDHERVRQDGESTAKVNGHDKLNAKSFAPRFWKDAQGRKYWDITIVDDGSKGSDSRESTSKYDFEEDLSPKEDENAAGESASADEDDDSSDSTSSGKATNKKTGTASQPERGCR